MVTVLGPVTSGPVLVAQSEPSPAITPWPLIIVVLVIASLSLVILWAQNTSRGSTTDGEPEAEQPVLSGEDSDASTRPNDDAGAATDAADGDGPPPVDVALDNNGRSGATGDTGPTP